MEFKQADFNKLDVMERRLREMANHYGYSDLRELALHFMRFMREVRVPSHTSTWPTPPNGGNAA